MRRSTLGLALAAIGVVAYKASQAVWDGITGSRLVCRLLTGHKNSVYRVHDNRMWLVCQCGHETPGWEITGNGPTKKFDGDPTRHVLHNVQKEVE